MELAGRDRRQLVLDILTDSFDTNKSVNYVVKQDIKRRDPSKICRISWLCVIDLTGIETLLGRFKFEHRHFDMQNFKSTKRH